MAYQTTVRTSSGGSYTVTNPGSAPSSSGSSGGSSSHGSSQPGVKQEGATAQQVFDAKVQADAIKASRASEVAARGGSPVSAQERSDLAMQQAYRYGVGIVPQARDVSPTVIKDASGRVTVVSQADTYRNQAATFAGGQPAQDVRQYGTWQNKVAQQETERQANKQSYEAKQPKVLNTPKQLQQKNDTSIPTGKSNPIFNNFSDYSLFGLQTPQRQEGKQYQSQKLNDYSKGFSETIKDMGIFVGSASKGFLQTGYNLGGKQFIEPVINPIKPLFSKVLPSEYSSLKNSLNIPEIKGEVYSTTIVKNPNIQSAGMATLFLIPGTKEALLTYGGITGGINLIKNPTPYEAGKQTLPLLGLVHVGLRAPGAIDAALRPYKINVKAVAEPSALAGHYPSTTPKNTIGLIEEFRTGDYGLTEKSGVTRGMIKNIQPSNPLFAESKLIVSKPGGFHLSAGSLPKDVIISVGDTPGATGVHIAPSASLNFARLPGESGTMLKFSLLPKINKPTAQWISVDVGRIPSEVRAQGTSAMIKWLETEGAKQNKAFVSPAFELGKTEKEGLVTGFMKRTRSEEVITGLSQKIPINRYEKVFPGEKITPQILSDTKAFMKESAANKEYAAGTRYVSLSEVLPKNIFSSGTSVSKVSSTPQVVVSLSSEGKQNFEKNYLDLSSSKEIVSSVSIPKSNISLRSSNSSKSSNDRSAMSSSVSEIPKSSSSNSLGDPVSSMKSLISSISRSSEKISENSRSESGSSTNIFLNPPLPPRLISQNSFPQQNSEGRGGSGYFVVFREFGKEVRGNTRSLTKIAAENFGRDVTKQSISASYKVVRGNPYQLQQAKRIRFATGAGVNPSNYAPGKSNALKGFNVEKQQFRISSLGAKTELKEAKKKHGGWF